MHPMHVRTVQEAHSGHHELVLTDEEEQHRLSIFVGAPEAAAIRVALEGTRSPRPMIHDLLATILTECDITIQHIAITELRNGTFHARITLFPPQLDPRHIDARPSDALALAVRMDLPILVDDLVVATSGCKRGTLIDIGGTKFSVHIQGTGGPTVIFEAGAGGIYQQWGSVPARIAQSVTVCGYDRAGLGWSDSRPQPRTFHDTTHELHTLLEYLQLARPYIFVGHSVGGLLARVYCERYPEEIAGVVLIDSGHPEYGTRALAALPEARANEPAALQMYRQQLDSTGTVEWADWSTCLQQVRACSLLGDRPLVVVSAGKAPARPEDFPKAVGAQQFAVWQQLQTELPPLSTHSRQIIAEHSGHAIQLDEPDVVIHAIQDVIADNATPFL